MAVFTRVRIKPLALGYYGRNHWQYADCSDGKPHQVGPIYKTKLEALADLESYARRAGWIREGAAA